MQRLGRVCAARAWMHVWMRRHCEERKRRRNPDLGSLTLDCFAEPVIGPRFAQTRWLTMT